MELLVERRLLLFSAKFGSTLSPPPQAAEGFFFKVISTVLPGQEECTQNLCSSLLCNAFFFPGGQCTKPYVMLLYVLFFCFRTGWFMFMYFLSARTPLSTAISLQTSLGKWPICINLNFPPDNYYAGLSFKNTVPVTYFSSISKRDIVK